MVILHVAAGSLALVSGAAAMGAKKGGALHRRSGIVFVCSMLFMAASGAVMASFVPERASVLAGALTCYMVATAWLTVRRTVPEARKGYIALMCYAIALGALGYSWGFEALGNARTMLDGMPAPMYFVFSSVALLAACLDARMLRAGSIQGAHRLARHLWRMGYAMFVATASFFLGQADELPEALRKAGVLPMPVLIVIGFTLFWLVRVLRKRRNPAALPMRSGAAA